jgi:hypothetical protein
MPPGEMGAVEAMATHLGMDPARDKELLWIARQALHAPRPSGWSEVRDEAGKVYYVEEATGRTSWWLPTDEEFRRLYRLKRSHRADAAPLGAPRSRLASDATAASLPPAGPPRSASAQLDREKDRDATDPRRGSASSAPGLPSGICSAGRVPSGSARSVLAPGGELRPSGAVLLPLSPRQRLRAEFWASVGAAPTERGKTGATGPVAQWHASVVARVKNRLAVREQIGNPVASHTARARERRAEARARSREVGRELAPPRRERALSGEAGGSPSKNQPRRPEETAVQSRQVRPAPLPAA